LLYHSFNLLTYKYLVLISILDLLAPRTWTIEDMKSNLRKIKKALNYKT